MKVKKFKKKYKDYSIELYGRPLSQKTIPYTLLPRDKKIDDCEVIDFDIKEKDFVQYRYNLKTQTFKTENKKGYVRAYVK